MNYHRLPPAPRTSLPAFIEPARVLEPLYKAEGGQGGAEASAAQLRAMFFKCLHLVLKYKLLFAFFCCVSLLIGLIMTLLTPKIYSAATTVKIDRVVPRILNTQMSGQAESSLIPDLGKPNFCSSKVSLWRSGLPLRSTSLRQIS